MNPCYDELYEERESISMRENAPFPSADYDRWKTTEPDGPCNLGCLCYWCRKYGNK